MRNHQPGADVPPLPLGLIKNTPEIYRDLARHRPIPGDVLLQMWRVYTSTAKSTRGDPTAQRLEQFWWRVIGSERRLLTGSTLSDMFKEISEGPTAVKLLGPSNRYEGPLTRPDEHVLDRNRPDKLETARRGQSEQGPRRRHDRDLDNKVPLKKPTPSSSRPPPSNSILKKPRVPSASGPRLTALRFADPPSSDSTAGVDKETKDRATALASSVLDVGMLSPLKPTPTTLEKREAVAGGKKYAVSTSASKKSPVLPRRQISHLSTSSNQPLRNGSSAPTKTSTVKAPDNANARFGFQGGGSGSSVTSEGLFTGSNTAGKRPYGTLQCRVDRPPFKSTQLDGQEAQRRSLAGKKSSRRGGPSPISTSSEATNRRQASLPYPVIGFVNSIPVTRPTIPSCAPVVEPPRMERSFSNSTDISSASSSTLSRTSQHLLRDNRAGGYGGGRRGDRLPAHDLVSSSMAAVSNTTVMGRFDTETMTPVVLPGDQDVRADVMLGRQPSSQSLHHHIHQPLRPTQPSNAPPVPLGRSKSQLSFLLEQNRDRTKQQKR